MFLPSLFFNILNDAICVSYVDNTDINDVYDD